MFRPTFVAALINAALVAVPATAQKGTGEPQGVGPGGQTRQ